MIAQFYYSHDRATRWRLLGVVALACLVFIFRYDVVTGAEAIVITMHYGYWFMAATFLLFVVALWTELRPRWPGWAGLKPHWPGLLAAVLVALFWQVHEPHDFKVLFDEHVLGAIARTMHYEREGSYSAYAYQINGHLISYEYAVDKRPLMYPFLVSIFHDLTGFRPANSFVANGVFSFILLLLTYALGAALGGPRIGCLGQFLLAGLPLLAQNATGGGFDLLNITLITGFLLAAWHYWRQPGVGGLDLFVFLGLVLANVRYESMLFLGVLAAVVLCKWIRERHFSLTLVAALSPMFVLPPMLINKIFMGGGGGGYFQTSESNFLNVSHLVDNLQHAVYFLFQVDFEANNSVLLSAVGIVALLFTLLWILRRLPKFLRESSAEIPFLLVLLGALAITFVSLLSFWGHWDEPQVERFSLPFYNALAWCAMFVTARSLRLRQLPRAVVAGAAIYAVAAGAPVSSYAYTTDEMQSYATYRWVRDYVLEHSDDSVLIASRSSVLFTLYNRPNIHFGILNHHPEMVVNLVKLGFYHELWVVQEYVVNGKLNAWVEFPPARVDQRLVLQPIAEREISLGYRVRISRVIGYDGTRPAGTVRLASEMDASKTEDIRKGLGGVYTPPTGTESVLTERPADEPPAFPGLTELPEDPQQLFDYMYQQYPHYP